MPDYKLVNHYGLSEAVVAALIAGGYRMPHDIRSATDETLLALDDIDESAVAAIRAALGECIA